MANNVMWMIHIPSGQRLKFAKYYPSTGWYQYAEKERVNKFMEETSSNSPMGNTDYKLEFADVHEEGAA